MIHFLLFFSKHAHEIFNFQEVYQLPTGIPTDPDVVMEGYLMKRATNAFKTWNRRWFQIKDDKLVKMVFMN